MQKVTREQLTRPESTLDPEVIAFKKQFEPASPLDELVRQGAQQMLQAAIESEVQDFLWQHSDRTDDQWHSLLGENAPNLSHGVVVPLKEKWYRDSLSSASRIFVERICLPLEHFQF